MSLVVDGGGPAVSIANELEAVGLEVTRMSQTDVSAACAGMYDAIADRRVAFRSDASFDEAISGLQRRPVGDRFVWSRSNSASDITPFMAATLALAAAAQGNKFWFI